MITEMMQPFTGVVTLHIYSVFLALIINIKLYHWLLLMTLTLSCNLFS